MDDQNKSKEQLIQEIAELRTRLTAERKLSQSAVVLQSQGSATESLESDDRFQLLLKHLPLGYQSLDENGCILEVNQAWLDTLGYSREEVIGRSFSSFLHPDWADHFKEKFPRFKSVSEVLGTEFIMVKAGGSIFQVSCTGKKEQDAEGNFKRTHCILQDISDRKRHEEKLRESEEEKRLALEAVQLGTWIYTPQNHDIFWDQRSREIFSVSPDEEVDERKFLSLIHPEDRETIRKTVETVLDPEKGTFFFNVHFRISLADGSVRWIRSNGKKYSKIEEDGEKIVRVIGTHMDITERRQAEEALQESELRYREMYEEMRALFAAMIDLVFIFNSEGRYLKIIETSPSLLYKPSNELLGKTFHEVFPKAQADFFLSRLMQALNTRQPVSFEYSLPFEEKQYWFDATVSPISDEKILMVARDITARKQAEALLRENERHFRKALNIETVGVLFFDFEGNFHFANDAFLRMIGYDRDALERGELNSWCVTLPAHIKRTRQAFQELIENGRLSPYEKEMVRPDGSRWWGLFAGTRLNEKEAMEYVIDITERKQAEEAKRRLNETLEQKVAERTALAESRAKQLQHLAVELIEAEEHERQRISNLLHEDLQQLLAATRMTLQSKRQRDAETKEAERLLEIAISKSRHLSHELSPPVLHHSGLTAALEWLGHQMHKSFGLNIQLRIETRPKIDIPLRLFLFRAIQELLFNVVKHAGVDTAHVTLSGAADETIITVIDHGRGFETSILETHTPKAGLGLRSLRERASHIGGSLAIESEPGQGSRFILRVPAKVDTSIHQVLSMAAGQERNQIVESAVSIGDANCIRILFADDHKVMRQGLIRLVSGKPNISVVGEAANGKETLDLARRFKPNVVVMDVSMPVMDGIEATRRIKAEMPDVHVLGLSMHEDEHISAAIREAGAEAFLSKAASSSELLGAIYEVAGQAQESTPASNKKGPTQLKLPLT